MVYLPALPREGVKVMLFKYIFKNENVKDAITDVLAGVCLIGIIVAVGVIAAVLA